MSTATISSTGAGSHPGLGYKTFSIGNFKFDRGRITSRTSPILKGSTSSRLTIFYDR